MDIRFSPHNTHRLDPDTFTKTDPQLRRLIDQPYVCQHTLLDQLPTHLPGIYTLGGGRQIGKTTLLKQWMLHLLAQGISPHNIAFLSGELIDDHHVLLNILQTELANMPKQGLKFILLDEVTYIRAWDKAIKYAADLGLLDSVILLITGSDLMLIQEARMTFPGRRGLADQQDFHLYPLSFKEFLILKNSVKDLESLLSNEMMITESIAEQIEKEFHAYMQHGGYLTAINDLALHGKIATATLNTYSDWIRGDVIKHGKQEVYLRELLSSIIKCYGSQVTWNSLAKDLPIDHPKTIADYIEILGHLDAVFVQQALREEKLSGAPKTARKVIFTDNFIFHAVRHWLSEKNDPYHTEILPATQDPILLSKLVEATVAAHYRRFYPTYYIKAEGEVDIAYIDQGKFWPIEIKWTQQMRSKDLKQVSKYRNSRIFTKNKLSSSIQEIPCEWLPLALLKIGQRQIN